MPGMVHLKALDGYRGLAVVLVMYFNYKRHEDA